MINELNEIIYDYIFSSNIDEDYNLCKNTEKERIEKLNALFKSQLEEKMFWDENKYEFNNGCINYDFATLSEPNRIGYNNFPRMKYNTKTKYLEYKTDIIKTDIQNFGTFYVKSFIENTEYLSNIAKQEILEYAKKRNIINYKTTVFLESDENPPYILYKNIIPGDMIINSIRENTNKNVIIDKNKNEMTIKRNNEYTERLNKEYDVFISHANADKDDYVEELYATLLKYNLKIFYDKNTIDWGDKWKEKIIEGTNKSEFAIIVISNNFFGRVWAEIELSEFLNRQNNSGQKIILPILHKITIQDLEKKYPSLANIQALNTKDKNCNEIAIEFIKQLIERLKK